MKSTAKAQAQVRSLKERLEARFSGSATINSVRQANDANGWPMLFCSIGGVEAATNPVIAVRIKSQDAVSKDVFGNALVAFSPHDLELAYETAVPARTDIIKAMAELGKMGFKILVKEIIAATAVTEASIDAAAVAASLESEVQWPSKGM